MIMDQNQLAKCYYCIIINYTDIVVPLNVTIYIYIIHIFNGEANDSFNVP